MAKINYYNIENLLKTNAQYMLLLGKRANGKSYQVKKTVLESAFNTGKKFVYLRRWREDIKTKYIESYFDDMPIKKLTKGQFDRVIAWNGFLFFGTVDDNGRTVRGQEIGRYCALNEYERYKSQTFVDYEYIVFEEFITDSIYLVDEPKLLQQFISTVARSEKMTVLLIGNTLTRVCPYFVEWCLDKVLTQKIGTIELYHFHGVDGSTVTIAVEYCKNDDAQNKMFFGQSAKQIVSGEWDTKEVAKLPRPITDYECVYELIVEYQAFKFLIELLVEKYDGGVICFIHPHTSKRKVQRIISDVFSDNPFISARLDTSRRPEQLIASCFENNKVCYSDNLTGSDFINVNKHFHLSPLF